MKRSNVYDDDDEKKKKKFQRISFIQLTDNKEVVFPSNPWGEERETHRYQNRFLNDSYTRKTNQRVLKTRFEKIFGLNYQNIRKECIY